MDERAFDNGELILYGCAVITVTAILHGILNEEGIKLRIPVSEEDGVMHGRFYAIA